MRIGPDGNVDEIAGETRRLLQGCRDRSLMLSTAESCTGGLIAAALTDVPGSSDVFERGFITYSNEAKISMLGVRPELIDLHGAVSEEVARAMAEGALIHSNADVAVAVTGIAGPAGGSPTKPVGLVHIAAARAGVRTIHLERRYGALDRNGIRMQSVLDALSLANEIVGHPQEANNE